MSELKSLEKQGYRIEVLIGAKENPAYDDQMLIKHLSNELNHGWTLVNAKSMDEWLSTINKAGLLISGRFHHTIAALSLQTPFVVLNSNTPKIEGMLKLAGLESKRVLYYNDPRLDTLLREEIEHTLNCSNHNFPSLDHLCDLAEKNFDGLKKISAKNSADIFKFKRYESSSDSTTFRASKKEPRLTQ